MAVGDISARLDKEYLDDEAYFAHGAHRGNNIFVCLYGTAGSSYVEIRAISIADDGTVTLVDSWNPTVATYTHYIAHVSGSTFAFFYSDYSTQAGIVKTFSVDASGNITKSWIATYTFASGSFPEDVWLRHEPVLTDDDIYLIATQASNDISIWSLTISADGATITEKDKLQIALTQNKNMAMRKANGDIYAIYSEQFVNAQILYTFECDSSGNLTYKDSLNLSTVSSGSPGMVQITDGVILIARTIGWRTYSIDASGTIGSLIDSASISQCRYLYNFCQCTQDGARAIVYQSGDNVYSRSIALDGTIGDVLDSLDLDLTNIGAFHIVEGDTTTAPSVMWVSFTPASPTFDLFACSFTIESAHPYGDRIYVWLGTEGDPEQIELTDPDYPTVLGVRTERGRDEELGHAASGIAEVTCDNFYGDYSPERTDGAYYGLLKLGAFITIFEVYDGTRYDIFCGKIDEIEPHPEPDDLTAFILAVDGMDDLAGSEIETVLREDTDSQELIGDILDAAGDDADRDLDAGIDTLQLGWFHQEFALPSIQKVEDITRGFFLIDVDGTRVWQNRHYRVTGDRLNSQFDFEENLVEIKYKWSKRDVKNWARVTGSKWIDPYYGLPEEEWIWYAPAGDASAVFVPVNTTVTVWAPLTGPMKQHDTLVKGTHWNANTAYDKTGTDVSDDITVTVTDYGQAIKFDIENAGDSDAYMVVPDSPPSGAPDNASLLVYGTIYEEVAMAVVEEDSTSQDDYGKRTVSIDARFKSNYNDILAYAQWLVARFKDPLPTPVTARVNAWTNYPDDTIKIQCLTRKISDRVTLASTNLGIDQDYFIDKIIQEYTLLEGGTVHMTEYALSRAEGQAEGLYWLIGVTGYSELGQTTRLGF